MIRVEYDSGYTEFYKDTAEAIRQLSDFFKEEVEVKAHGAFPGWYTFYIASTKVYIGDGYFEADKPEKSKYDIKLQFPNEFEIDEDLEDEAEILFKGVSENQESNPVVDLKANDPINPSHYTLDLPCESFDYQAAVCKRVPGDEAACVFNVLKYVTRYKLKAGLVDLKKSRWYLDKLIEIVEKKNGK